MSGSPDGTADIVKRMQKEFPERLFMVEWKGKLGLGTAYICGFKGLIQTTSEVIFTYVRPIFNYIGGKWH